jgi:hypothetical protein
MRGKAGPLLPRAALVAVIGILAAGFGPGWLLVPPAARAETQTISDGATTEAPDRVPVGSIITITGRGWTTPKGQGSVVAVKLDDGDVRTQTQVVNPATGDAVSDPSIVTAVRATATGEFSVAVPAPARAGWGAGTRHSVRLLSGKLLTEDATRSVALVFDMVSAASSPSPSPTSSASEVSDQPTGGNQPPGKKGQGASAAPSVAPTQPASSSSARVDGTTAPAPARSDASSAPTPTSSGGPAAGPGAAASAGPSSTAAPGAGARVAERAAAGKPASERSACSAQQPSATLTAPRTVRGVPVVDQGGLLTVTGSGFCGSPAGTTIAVQIDDGALLRLDSSVAADRGTWQIISAAPDGTFAAAIRLPRLGQTAPAFADGVHRLRLLSRSSTSKEAVRSVRTVEFVVATGNNAGVLPEPTSVPVAADPEVALVGSKAGSVTTVRTASTVRVVVPGLAPGDWVYPYVYPRAPGAPRPAGAWQQLDRDRSIALDVDDVIDGGHPSMTRVSLQARDGSLVGWATVSPTVTVPASTVDSPMPTAPSAVSDDSAPRSPRPLVVGGGLGVMAIGVGLLLHARHRHRRLLRDLNGE